MQKTLTIIFVLTLLTVNSLFAQNAALSSIEKRAAEIAGFLGDEPRGFATVYYQRDVWDDVAKNKAFADAVQRGVWAAEIVIEPFNETLYREYFKNGNRENYQNWRGKKYSQLSPLVIAECIENKGRFVPNIVALINSICDDKSWVLPAHDYGAVIVDGKDVYIDLASADTSFGLAIACYWLGDKLPNELRERVTEEIERRTFVPYENAIRAKTMPRGMWWVNTTNNWNSVCHAGVIGAAVLQIKSKERRAFFVAAAEHYTDDFFKGFTDDGYCSEGLGYWNYGFGNFVTLSETIYRETDGKVDLFKLPKVRNVALFGARMEITPNLFAAFADCSITARPGNVLTGFISRRLGLGLESYENAGLYPNTPSGNLIHTAIYCFPNSAVEHPAVQPTEPLLGIRTKFEDAGIYICRPQKNERTELAAVFKGGHNGEHHNHNDVGSFVVSRGGVLPLIDPGGEVYTQRTFSSRRYDSNLLNSFGHPVPKINGKLQQTGTARKGVVIESENSDAKDVYRFDIASAYDQKEIKKLERRFVYDRQNHGAVEVTDTFELTEPGTFETALVTYQTFKNVTDKTESDKFVFVVGDEIKKQSVKVTITTNTNATLIFETTEIKENSMAKKNPIRLAFKLKEQTAAGNVIIKVEPY
ncbi:MAG: heparinase II/III-family protein [Planctomycetaceae bacterium]|jgi:hypothetical protein|nr:heparinase II/III-family protein [Planctomycetaceae bacterium]